jgi:hypothetical protein
MVISNLILAAAIVFLASGVIRMSDALTRLRGSVAALTNVSASAVTLISGLAQAIRDNAEDPAALNELADQIDADASGLAASVTENTPVSTAPGVQPEPGTATAPATTDEGDDTPTGEGDDATRADPG